MLRRLFSSRKRHRPDFDERRLIRRAMRRSEAIQAHFSSGLGGSADASRQMEHLALYFRQRNAPRFFVQPEELTSIIQEIEREHPQWRVEAIRQARSICETALGVYGSNLPALGAGFSWNDMPRGPGQDKLYAKRPHRFAFAPRLALAALYGEATAKVLTDLLADWKNHVSSNSANMAYDSNLAVIQRLLALSWCFYFLSGRSADTGAEGLLLEAKILGVIKEDIRFLADRIGQSYPNNHLLADMFAGWFIGLIWPEFSPRIDWRQTYEALFVEQLHRQLLPDGSSFEHSTHYHEFACEMGSAYVILNRNNGYETAENTSELVRRALLFQSDLAGPESTSLILGDSVEEPFFPLDGGCGWGTAAWRDLVRAIFNEPVPPAEPGAAARERAFWLMSGKTNGISDPEPEPGLSAYPNGGFYVFRDESMKSRLTFRTGPSAGDPICAGHMHADWMSVYLSVSSRPFLVDSGNYTYRSNPESWPKGEPAWRQYFRGPAAHNALSVDGADPLGEVHRDFRPQELDIRVDTRRFTIGQSAAWVESRVIGGAYSAYRRGVVHIHGEYWLIYDLQPPAMAGRNARFSFQFDTAVQCGHVADGQAEMIAGEDRLVVAASTGLGGPEVRTGSREPLGGWISRRYGDLCPAPQLVYPVREDEAPTAFVLRTDSTRISVLVDKISDSALRFEISSERGDDTLLLNMGDVSDVVAIDDVQFVGELLWLRSRNHLPVSLRWANARRFTAVSSGIEVIAEQPQPELDVNTTATGISVRYCDRDSIDMRWPGQDEFTNE